MPPQAIIGTILSVIAAAPAIAVYGVFSAAILSGRRGGGFLIVLITAPFLIPLLIFGLGAVDSYASAGLAAVEFRALIGLSLIAIAVGIGHDKLPRQSCSLFEILQSRDSHFWGTGRDYFGLGIISGPDKKPARD